MPENFRSFEAGPDPLGRAWQAEFLWIQNGIAIRRSDTVDVKFALSSGEQRETKVIAFPHARLIQLSEKAGRPLTDSWCIRLAARYLKWVLESGEDLEKRLITARQEALEALALEAAPR